MENTVPEKHAMNFTGTLKVFGALMVTAGVVAASALLFLVSPETLELAAEDIVMSANGVLGTGLLVMFMVVSSGVLAVIRLPLGWLFAFLTATVVLLMGLLMGPGTLPVVRYAFSGMMALSLVCWAHAILYYHYDLYS